MQKIIELKIENIKKIKTVELLPNGKPVVTIAGKNGAGKSSVLDAITYCLGGAKTQPDNPVTLGEQSGSIVLKTEDWTVERRIGSDGKNAVAVWQKGVKVATPQTILDRLVGSGMAFDPSSFLRLDRTKKIETVKKILGLDFEDLRAEYERTYSERREINKDLDALKTKIDSIPAMAGLPEQPVDLSELMTAQQVIISENNKAKRTQLDIVDAEFCIKFLRFEIDQHIAKIEQLEENLLNWRNMDLTLKTEDDFAAKIKEAENLNKKIADSTTRKELEKIAKSKQQKCDELNDTLDKIRQAKTDRINAVKLPVDGLVIDDSGIFLNGVDIEQLSSAEKIKIAVALRMAESAEFGVILLRDGVFLDDDNFKILADLAVEKNLQLWIEKIAIDDRDQPVIIEEGLMKC